MINGHGGNFFFFSLLRSESHYIRAGRMWKHRKYTRKVHRKLRTEQLMRSSVLLFGISFPNQHRAAGVSVLHVLFFSSVVCVCVCFWCGRAGPSVEIDTTKLQKEENWGFAAL